MLPTRIGDPNAQLPPVAGRHNLAQMSSVANCRPWLAGAGPPVADAGPLVAGAAGRRARRKGGFGCRRSHREVSNMQTIKVVED